MSAKASARNTQANTTLQAAHASLVLSTGWGLLFLVLVAGPLGTVAVRPGTRTTAVGQVAVAGVAVGVAAALSGSPRHLLVAGGLLATAVALVAVRLPTRARAQAAGRTSELRPSIGGRTNESRLSDMAPSKSK